MQITNRNMVFVITCVLFCIGLIAFFVYPSARLYYIIRTSYSKTTTPWAYVLPIERELKGKIVSGADVSRIESDGIRLSIPWGEVSERVEPSMGLIVCDKSSKSESDKFIIISNRAEDISKFSRNILEGITKEFLSFLETKHGGKPFSEYELIEIVLATTPDQFGLRNSLEELGVMVPLLILKSAIIINAESVFTYKKNNLNYIQFGRGGDNGIVTAAIYKNGSSPSVIKFKSCSQEEIETILSNLKKN
jgi:hypothetical protein